MVTTEANHFKMIILTWRHHFQQPPLANLLMFYQDKEKEKEKRKNGGLSFILTMMSSAVPIKIDLKLSNKQKAINIFAIFVQHQYEKPTEDKPSCKVRKIIMCSHLLEWEISSLLFCYYYCKLFLMLLLNE